MSLNYLICIILFSKQTLPLLGYTIPTNNQSFIYDFNSLPSNPMSGDWRPRVINGTVAALGDCPYQIALKTVMKKSSEWYKTFCGAALIGPRKLLSAAHCFDEKSFANCNLILHPGRASSKKLKEALAVAGGLKNLAKFDTDGQWRELETVQYPKSYDFPKDDISVIITNAPFEFNDHVNSVPIARIDIDYEGTCLASGFGRVGKANINSKHSPVLLKAYLVLLSKNTCALTTDKPRNNNICTDTRHTDVSKIALKALMKRSSNLYQTFCGAALIGPRKLLSAAHCFDEKAFASCHPFLHPGQASSKRLKQTLAVAGGLKNYAKFNSDGQWRKLETAQFPKSYDFPKDDISVIITNEPFEFNDHVNSIPIARIDIDYEGTCLASGFGRVGKANKYSKHSPVLLKAYLVLLPKIACARTTDKPRNNNICTDTRHTDVSKGDSGGPLVCANTGDPNEDKYRGLLPSERVCGPLRLADVVALDATIHTESGRVQGLA
ncbi:hypothetical protein PYW08_003324 [Mythimna loreyi]|uniref:Uncharacterized protein n=1 Tax=Mythimna loreyi TaxID=667449 RepID=A0ACC2QQS8_9NEOP|nr:hypothetical protein PYW08_003324 [Mythimna loreyi]